MTTAVPFIDLVADWQPLKDEVLARVARLFEHGQFIMGPEVQELQRLLETDCSVAHAVTCSSGTMALQLALMALDIGPGDEVIVPAFTFAAPIEAILLQGATPVLADVHADTLNLDVESCARLIGPRTRAIIAVSLFGQPADFDALNALARQHGLRVIEDAAQSYGATLHGRRSGGLADIGCTSFFPTKPFGGAGEGGALFTQDEQLAQRIREARDHGQSTKYLHSSVGTNGRLDALSCCALLVALERLPEQLARRQAIARRYDLGLAAAGNNLRHQGMLAGASSVYAQYAVRLEERDRLVEYLRDAGIQVAVHYPTPAHQQPAFANRCRYEALPNSEQACRQVLCLPLYPTLEEAAQQRVIEVMLKGLQR
ncbi:DegT/DnrJ/EryC1/StrS family aminotransferase [Pseudomonas sp. LABIM340]|uniref:DegT/DnrJ/EryC1/StrS family aminotransferase n=1 Tax=Pseudomonas nitroreducens TaxID=46680 RepID=A0A5R8ZYM3_PSENT|nr:DegT/DnrJ/EryC1/StrS family aminotransferase [Pseudomonas nitroreducens]TLP70955.1 DegT/DnrJ/EryC1/StrS family aminotransferase [Pseudomonas nitroreducens]